MAEIIINDVKYTNVPNKKAGTKFAAALTQSNIGISQAVQDYVNSSYFYALVNAIDINWDGIDIGENTYINTTSDLIKWIESKAGDIDLSSYATVAYVNQKFEDLIGGAPETLDTLKELADALQEDASLAYVTEALSGKADKTDLNDYATVSYVTSELEKKANLSDIPSAPDLTPYVTYADANSYYATISYANQLGNTLDGAKDRITNLEDGMSDYALREEIPDMTSYVSKENLNSIGYLTYNNANTYYVLQEDYGRPNLYEMDEDSGSYILNNPFLSGGNYHDVNFVAVKNNNLTVGENTILSYSFIFGKEHIVGGSKCYRNFVFGQNHTLYGVANSFVVGSYNIVTNGNESAFGHYNISHDGSNNSGKTLLSIGNGTSVSMRHNILEIQESGDIYICNTAQGTPYCLQTTLNSKLTNTDLIPYVSYTQANSYYAGKNEIPDLTPYVSYSQANSYYVDINSYNALYEEVQHLAYLISYYHPVTPDPGPTPAPPTNGYWTYNGMNYNDSITLSTMDSSVLLEFVGTPSVQSATSTWTFTAPVATGIQVASITGNIDITPSSAAQGTYYITAYYPGDDTYSPYTKTFTITITGPSKLMPMGHFVDGNNNQVEMPLVRTDEGSELEDLTLTLVTTPASGWTLTAPPDWTENNHGVYINGNTITFGSVQSPENEWRFIWSYPEDSTYYSGVLEMRIIGLEYGADTQFFPECGNSEVVTIQSGTTYNNYIVNRTGIDLSQHPISWSSDNQNVTVTPGAINNEFIITNTATGTYQYATITGTVTDGNDTHTTNVYIEFNNVTPPTPPTPTPDYTNVSILYNTQNAQNLPQGTFDTNPFEIGGDFDGNKLGCTVQFTGAEYDMNNFNTDFVLTRDTSYAGDYTTVYIDNYDPSNTYANGVNTLTFNITIYAWQDGSGSEPPGTNRDVLTFTHNGVNYITDGIKTHIEPGVS